MSVIQITKVESKALSRVYGRKWPGNLKTLCIKYRDLAKKPSRDLISQMIQTLDAIQNCIKGEIFKLDKVKNSEKINNLNRVIEFCVCRKEYLSLLQKYLTTQKATINELVKVAVDSSKERTYRQESSLTSTSLYEIDLIEGLDPFHRTWTEKGVNDEFKSYCANMIDKNMDPAEMLVEFFLQLGMKIKQVFHGKYGDVVNTYNAFYKRYFDKDQVKAHQIRFKEGIAYAVYIKDESNRYYKYDPHYYPDPALIVHLKPFHTFSVLDNAERKGKVVFGDENMHTRPDHPDLNFAFLYVMQNEEICTYPPKISGVEMFHSMGARGKFVESGGCIVARNGKILAIDNMSGHYRPGYHLLYQAVRKINKEGAFDAKAMVGVSAGALVLYFPVKSFLKLGGSTVLHKEHVLQELNQLKKDYKNGPKDLPHAELGIYDKSINIWREKYKNNWDTIIKEFWGKMYKTDPKMPGIHA